MRTPTRSHMFTAHVNKPFSVGVAGMRDVADIVHINMTRRACAHARVSCRGFAALPVCVCVNACVCVNTFFRTKQTDSAPVDPRIAHGWAVADRLQAARSAIASRKARKLRL